MITQSEFLRELASCTHFTLGDLMNRANRLRDAGKLGRGGRGLAAAKIGALEGAWIITAAMSGESANECAKATQQLSDDMPLLNPDGSKCEEVSVTAITGDSVRVQVPETGRALDVISCIAEILEDPLKADHVKSFTLDHANKKAVLSWDDGRDDVFGQLNEDTFDSGVKVFLHGRVFRMLACSMLPDDERHKDPAYFKWVSQVVKIGNEQGDEAAQAWMKDNPFKPVKK